MQLPVRPLLLAAVGLCSIGAWGQAPVIESFTPTSGHIGTAVTIRGANFSPTPSENIVYFGAVRAVVTAAATNTLVVTAPAGATYEPITITTAGLTGAAGLPFVVTFSSSQSLQFDSPASYGIDWPEPGTVRVGDFDGDGRSDVATVLNFPTGNGSTSGGALLFQNQSVPGTINPGSLSLAASLYPDFHGVSMSARATAIADLDGDGRLDLLLTESNPDLLVIYRNLSVPGSLTPASFADPILLSLPNVFPTDQGLGVADLDGDGRPEIVVVRYGALSVLRNLTSPGVIDSNSFAPPIDILTNANPYAVVLADLDADGRPDIAALGTDGLALARNISTGPGIQNGSFGDPVWINISPSTSRLVKGDVDGDGRVDLVTYALVSAQSSALTILRNATTDHGITTNSFTERTEIPGPYFQTPGFIGLSDLNGDGKVDLILVTPKQNFNADASLSVFINQGAPGAINAGSFAPAIDFFVPVDYPPLALALADVDGDGKTDVLLSRYAFNGGFRPRAYLTVYHNSTPSPTNIPPTVSIVSPVNGASFTAPASFTLTADAADADGTVSQVDFFSSGVLLGFATNAPFSVNLSNLVAGSYTFTAKATDNLGAVKNSAGVTITVTPPPTAPALTTQPQSQAVVAGTNVVFVTAASGTAPLSYQWLFNGTNLPGATDATLTLANVQFANAGEYAVLVTNALGSATSVPAILTVLSAAGRAVEIGRTNATPGGSVNVPIRLQARGDENALEFSLVFDASVLTYSHTVLGSGATAALLNLNTNSITVGRVGLNLALATGAHFAPGTQEVVVVTFDVTTGIGNTTATIAFSDQPLLREISDVQANSLSADYLDGSVTIGGGGLEADVSPAPGGNGAVTVTDWVKVGRYSAGLDVVPNGSSFQRADCAPRATLGNGAITVTDWVQAGRYAAGLDALTPAGGPTGPAGGGAPMSVRTLTAAGAVPGTEVRLPTMGLRAGQTNIISVLLLAQGSESAVGFSLNFDAAWLTFVSATAGTNANGAILNVNASQAGSGQLGLVLSLPIGTLFPAGTRELAKLQFGVSSNAIGSSQPVFGDQPVAREVSDVFANRVNATYVNGTLHVIPLLAIGAAAADRVLVWPAWGTNFVLEASERLGASAVWSPPPAITTNISTAQIRVTVPNGSPQMFFRLRLR